VEALPREPPPGPEATALPPALKEEFGRLARGLVQGAAGGRAQARALEAYFRDNYEYSLEAELMGKGHPLAILITQRRPAYCAYFASAMAVLLRSLDVPARVVGGFVPEGTNPLTGRAMVRSRDAHAWVEAWLADEGRWVAFDPTPWRTRDAAVGVNRSPGLLGILGGALSSGLQRLLILVTHPVDLLRAIGFSPVTWVLVALFLVWRFRRGRGVRATFRAGAAMRPVDARLEALYRRYLKTLRRARLTPGPAETDDALLERLGAAVGAGPQAAARRFLEAYRVARYGGGAVEEQALAASLADLARALTK
jgi:transglutaminase-like putative cysteine protease